MIPRYWYVQVAIHSEQSRKEKQLELLPIPYKGNWRPSWIATFRVLGPDHLEHIKPLLDYAEQKFVVRRRFSFKELTADQLMGNSLTSGLHTWGTREFHFTADGLKQIRIHHDMEW